MQSLVQIIPFAGVEQESTGVSLDGKVTKLFVASNDVYSWTNKEIWTSLALVNNKEKQISM